MIDEKEDDDKENNNNCATIRLAPINAQNSIIEVTLDGHNSEALIDTGLDLSFVSEEFLSKNKLIFNTNSSKRIMMADRSKSVTSGVFKIELHILNQRYDCTLHVSNGLVVPLIIGMDLLKRH